MTSLFLFSPTALQQAVMSRVVPRAVTENVPDLLPVARRDGGAGAPAESFCDVDPKTGELLVRVRNQGNGSSLRPTVTRVILFPGLVPGRSSGPEVAEQLTPVLEPGQETLLRFPLAVTGRIFSITVDANLTLPEERNKGNNTVTGFCPPPPGGPSLPRRC